MQQLERLAAANIHLIPAADLTTHYLLERDGFVALVRRTDEGFGPIGSSGKATEHGFAALVWRGESAYFVARDFEQPASSDEIKELRRFSEDLQRALVE